jgi:dihydropteroate synthase
MGKDNAKKTNRANKNTFSSATIMAGQSAQTSLVSADMNRLLSALSTTPKPLVMGVVNVTPDSFSDGGQFSTQTQALDHALKLVDQGADILDIGGESTRPGAELVSVDEELARTIDLICAIRARTATPISIDTRKPEVARAAVAAGADCWNDVSALTYDDASIAAAVALQVPVILMHAKGNPKTMQDSPAYRDVTGEVLNFLVRQIGQAVAAGLPIDAILVDPGIGFGKTLSHNLTLMRDLKRIAALGRPVLFGASRKSFIGKIDGSEASGRLGGSLAAALWAADNGAAIVRVHDVAETVQALKVRAAIGNSGD